MAVLLFSVPNLPAQTSDFCDHFDGPTLDLSKWLIDNRPANGTIAGHKGFFTPKNIDFSTGMLRFTVAQKFNDTLDEVLSYGASIQSRQTFGYGKYVFVMRMASTSPTPLGRGDALSGNVSAAYTYINNAETELDIEYRGDLPDTLYTGNWNNPDPSQHPSPGAYFNRIRQYEALDFAGAADAFHTYVIDWEPTFVDWYVNDIRVAHHTTHVPKAPAHIKINLWGTNNPYWGGHATPEVTSYMYIRSVTFTPSVSQ